MDCHEDNYQEGVFVHLLALSCCCCSSLPHYVTVGASSLAVSLYLATIPSS